MSETSTDTEITRNEFILNYRNLVSSLENQQSNANIPIINYHKLLIEQEIFYGSGEELNHIRSEFNNVNWKISEVNQFFTALQRCGKHNPVEISRRVKTKTPLQVMMYIEQLENELQYAKEIGRIKNEPLNYENIPAAREMSKKWDKFETESAKILIQKLEENEVNCRNEIDSTNELKLQDKSKIDLFKLDTKTKDVKPSDHILCSLHDVLRAWLTVIIHDLIILNQHHKRLYPQENIKHLVTVQEIRRILRFRGYKIKGNLRQHMLANWKMIDQAIANQRGQTSNIGVPIFPQRNNSNIFLRNLDEHDYWSTDTDDNYDIEVEEEGNSVKISGNNGIHEDEEMKDVQSSDSSNYEDSDVELAKFNEQDYKLELKESTIDKLYEKALVKLLREHSTVNEFSKLREDKLESIFYHAIMWHDYINHIKLDKALEDF
ncbi:hypothetical protein C1645_760214 [Glomus cerebriforme]|uniref:Myb-like domain-containing protein n=1 Tax=Glomus cerebriforme TaxID=658196 RepID=A0A397THL3_9GLOM|nr:hypothetical protein C1645_760214 [Glomus cerebriforme]